MKAVFLDRDTFAPDMDLACPPGIDQWQCFDRTEPEQVAERIRDADIVIVNKVQVRGDAIAGAPRLKLIHLTATGTDNVDVAYCQQHGITVKNVAGYSTNSVAEHTFAFMLAALRGLLPYHQAVLDGSWQKDGRFCLNEIPIVDLYGKTLTIVGAGTIGRRVADIGRAFGMNIVLAERKGRPPRSSEYRSLEEAFAVADVISLHCPLNADTADLINDDTLNYCKKSPLLINLGRGPVVVSGAVVRALDSGRLAGYCTDVFRQEPPPLNEELLTLKNHPRVLFTPHNAWASEQSQRQLWQMLSEQVAAFLRP